MEFLNDKEAELIVNKLKDDDLIHNINLYEKHYDKILKTIQKQFKTKNKANAKIE